ncbi:Lacal_2735 family protein [Tenacibaculum sp. M341]|uniref:Lacal_2735 family protein n=1 Tax=Tenacibaculum sp. M341 TaxID=2530339 RepID=UPI0010515EEC|nr:Lacal_2735 family protein [Tenacibaculum sp. M341]TCI94386.1 Lacal_2735 family protein [Tenacibaculum sp. M341]
MFLNFFKKKTLEEKLKMEYEQLIIEGEMLDKQNTSESRQKYIQAERVLNKIESLKNAF